MGIAGLSSYWEHLTSIRRISAGRFRKAHKDEACTPIAVVWCILIEKFSNLLMNTVTQTFLIYSRIPHSCLKSSYKDERAKLFSVVTDNIARGTSHKMQLGTFRLVKQVIFFHWKDAEMLEKASQGGCEISISGDCKDLG